METLSNICGLVGPPGMSTPSNTFRLRLGQGGTPFQDRNHPTAKELKICNAHRKGELRKLLSKHISNKDGVRIPAEKRTSLQQGLVSIYDCPEAMDALSMRYHTMRSEGNHCAHTVQSVTRLQAHLSQPNHPLSLSTRKAISVFTQFYIDNRSLIPPGVAQPSFTTSTTPSPTSPTSSTLVIPSPRIVQSQSSTPKVPKPSSGGKTRK